MAAETPGAPHPGVATKSGRQAAGDHRVLSCSGLRRSFEELVAVDGVGFHIDAGETYRLLGPNGAGKTTTISMITGLLEPDAGEITVDGQPMTTRSVRTKTSIG